jgi:hypothetical protein
MLLTREVPICETSAACSLVSRLCAAAHEVSGGGHVVHCEGQGATAPALLRVFFAVFFAVCLKYLKVKLSFSRAGYLPQSAEKTTPVHDAAPVSLPFSLAPPPLYPCPVIYTPHRSFFRVT